MCVYVCQYEDYTVEHRGRFRLIFSYKTKTHRDPGSNIWTMYIHFNQPKSNTNILIPPLLENDQ